MHTQKHTISVWPNAKQPFYFHLNALRNEWLLDLMRFVYFNRIFAIFLGYAKSLYIINVFGIDSLRSNNIFFSFDKATNHNFKPSSIYLQSWLHQIQKLDLYEFSLLLLAFSFSFYYLSLMFVCSTVCKWNKNTRCFEYAVREQLHSVAHIILIWVAVWCISD